MYKAAAEKLEKDEALHIDCESFIIKKGNYRNITVYNFKNSSHVIEISYSDIDPNGYCIEWYFNDEDVKCMVRLRDN